MDGLLFYSLAVLAAMIIGLSKGGLSSVGVLSVPILSLAISPVTAAGLLLPVYVVSDVFGVIAYRRAFDWRNLLILGPAATVGVGIGWLMASTVPEYVVTGLVGLIGLAFAVNILIRKPSVGSAGRAAIAPGVFWGTIAGITSFVSHAGGPPYQVYVQPQRLEKRVFAGTTTILFAYVNAIKLIPYWALGQINLQSLHVAALLMVPAAISVWAGVKLVRIIPEVTFYRIVTWSLLAVSIKLIWDAATA